MSRKNKKYRGERISAIARKRARLRFKFAYDERQNNKPFARKEQSPNARSGSPIIAYDLETSRIVAGTPEVRYLTVYGADIQLSMEARGLDRLCEIVSKRLLTVERNHARYVAWNGNRYDVYFVAAALLQSDDYELKPYLSRSKNLRGLRVTARMNSQEVARTWREAFPHEKKKKPPKKLEWEFLDGMAMTGIDKPLRDFLKTFAPDYQKLKGPNFKKVEFDPQNYKHRRYAERDSEGLFHAMINAQQIVRENFNIGLQPTVGNLGIKIFQAHIPQDVVVWGLPYEALQVVRKYVYRGGYCWRQRKFSGPVWKYDINQAYAAAMRDAWLPAGRLIGCKGVSKYANCAMYRVRARHNSNTIPFYFLDSTGKARWEAREITETWLTSSELQQLQRERWEVEVLEGYFWDDAFSMRELVNKLEHLRVGEGRDPKSAQGEMMKAIGNNSYGKTAEILDGLEFILAREKPEGWYDYQGVEEIFQHIFFRLGDPLASIRDYHQPHVGAFITAHVRMEVRRAVLLAPEAWLYADTDCVIFDRPVDLPIDAKRYGYWKEESVGEKYWIINKKVYAKHDGTEKRAKGLNINHLKTQDFEDWFNGNPPEQTQVQRQNFMKVMTGYDMFKERNKVGEILR